MDEQFIFRKKFRNAIYVVVAAAIVFTVISILVSSHSSSRIWANILLNNQYFLGITLGGAFFVAVHRVALSGWHTYLQRLPDALVAYLPVAFILMLILYFGMKDIYAWTHAEGHNEVLEEKKIWLNIPFYYIRMVFYFAGWIALTWLMRRSSDSLITSSDIAYQHKRRLFASLFLVFYAITVSTSSWDWIMSLDPLWYSTIFGWYVFSSMFVTSLAFITLLIWFLKRQGYLSDLRDDHVHDMGTLMFAFSVFWTYMWYAQYELIWFGHLPEETSYFITRLQDYKVFFFLNLGINFLVPFLGLIRLRSKREINWVAVIAIILLAGHWLDYWLMIMPAAVGEKTGIGFLEISVTLLYAGIFIYVVLMSLASRPLVVKNDPFLQESLTYES